MRNQHFPGTFAMLISAGIMLSACHATGDTPLDVEKCKLKVPQKHVACTMQYDPVCGCDDKTYGNACMARGAGVLRTTPGACEGKANQ